MSGAEKERLIAKIKKVLALGQSSNEHEAALASSMAQELLDRYNLTMSDDEIREYFFAEAGYFPRWKVLLFTRLAKIYDLTPYRSMRWVSRSKKKSVLGVIGYATDREIFEYTFDYLSRTVEKMYRKKLKVEKQKNRYWSRRHSMALRSGYSVGVVVGICDKIELSRQTRMQEDSSMTALVLTRKDKVEQWTNESFPLKKSRSYRPGPQIGFESGKSDGQKIVINRGLVRQNKLDELDDSERKGVP